MTGNQLKPLAATLRAQSVAAERERSPKLAEAHDAAVKDAADATGANEALAEAHAALLEAAGALLTALSANEATIAGCATEIAALQALMPAADEGGGEG